MKLFATASYLLAACLLPAALAVPDRIHMGHPSWPHPTAPTAPHGGGFDYPTGGFPTATGSVPIAIATEAPKGKGRPWYGAGKPPGRGPMSNGHKWGPPAWRKIRGGHGR
ncbi:hypothetical protein CAC42_8023 [Sphaceloma murrayae]|uniref:Uncharacterized protein n=1 Tax=Sphaceloma murrayae TaxID=2082308 RepID=A0A2K1QRB7_9PEZI|nr:hypothetical protein CAC42_8023 [Sphaceloma murrayae]